MLWRSGTQKKAACMHSHMDCGRSGGRHRRARGRLMHVFAMLDDSHLFGCYGLMRRFRAGKGEDANRRRSSML